MSHCGGKAGHAPEVVRPHRRLRNRRHIARGAFEVHSRNCHQGAGYDGVSVHFMPQVVSLLQKAGEEVQGRAELLFAGREAAGELREGFDICTPEVVGVRHA